MVFVLVAVGFLGCLLTGEKVSDPMDGDVKKQNNKKNPLRTRIKKVKKKKENQTLVSFVSDLN